MNETFVAADVKAKFEKLYSEPRTETLATTLGIRFTHVEKNKLCAVMPVSPRTKQPFGLLHGGASLVLAETLASVGGWINAEGDGQVVGLEINANHIRSVKDGEVTASAVPLHLGRR